MPTTVVTLEAIEVAVEVTTFCMPPMSLVSRDWISPPRVRVKKPRDCRCRWSNTRVRRSCMTCWPTVVEIHVCTTPRIEATTVTASITPTAPSSSGTSWSGIAWSMRVRTRNGLTSVITDETTMSPTTSATCQR